MVARAGYANGRLPIVTLTARSFFSFFSNSPSFILVSILLVVPILIPFNIAVVIFLLPILSFFD